MTLFADEELYTVDEIAAKLRAPEGTFRSWRSQGRGPKSFKVGRRVVYRGRDVIAWLAAQEEITERGGK